ncbi:MAG: site-specific DNA-methyltransferase, partial [Synergistaceae bacterium]|nr:site-specific DNA-methyltransferase [Synergistaceae bacterium]
MPRKRQIADAELAKLRDIEDYTHDDRKRADNPKAGAARWDASPDAPRAYAFDPHADPALQWAGKAERTSFDVPTPSIHIHESIKPLKIIRAVQTLGDDAEEQQIRLFDSPLDRARRRHAQIEFYQHGVDWTNRLIAGDSLVIMNSLLAKEGMAGQVQMIYIDPPYGIKYGSNFQPFVDKRDVKDRKDEDLSQEPETIKAFRDTWELGIHSWLTYLRDRLLLARELLAESGSVFVQISDENVHHVREICDEVFGAENFVSMIAFRKTGSIASNLIGTITDYIVFYAKDISRLKFRKLFYRQAMSDQYSSLLMSDGSVRRISREERQDPSLIPNDALLFQATSLQSDGRTESADYSFEYKGKIYEPNPKSHWKTSIEGLKRLAEKQRILVSGNSLRYIRYFQDFPYVEYSNSWDDTYAAANMRYVVETSTEVVKRCMLMTTDPGDLVVDITCGSGTTPYVAEQWGRRWIACDTSRVAIALAKQRLMTATFDYWKLADPARGVGGGFVWKTVPHVTLKSIANDEPPATETLWDQPEPDRTKARVTGPFTVEALPAPVVMPLDEDGGTEALDEGAKQADWREQLLATGVLGRGGDRLCFSRVEPLSGTRWLQAEAETAEDDPRRALICFAGETRPMDARMVNLALDEAEAQRPTPQLLIFAAFQFDPEAARLIGETNWPGVTILQAQMNTDLMTADLKKKRSSDQSFWLVGQPDVELVPDERGEGWWRVRVLGFDYYDVRRGVVESGEAGRIAMWMLDADYDGMCVEPMQVFFPMEGKGGGWARLARTLRAEIDQELIRAYAGTESLPFRAAPGARVAVKIVDDRGIESLKAIR